ncbi:hypothetical protein DLAC_08039 [Tieghemostelium lacteum]|uniref:Uncharacterized protein n=1 Tax=Tieghemostelium lacteum TaxID=361077 RepID=A0A151ZB02_TIELA|nr:hypothetical protein DLAC_08039 [Tieghemostelium lacteum]|eukprot:KYQ91132.1 hypothetical protein DLAC_08039 [Tieghemostelium lacteum]
MSRKGFVSPFKTNAGNNSPTKETKRPKFVSPIKGVEIPSQPSPPTSPVVKKLSKPLSNSPAKSNNSSTTTTVNTPVVKKIVNGLNTPFKSKSPPKPLLDSDKIFEYIPTVKDSEISNELLKYLYQHQDIFTIEEILNQFKECTIENIEQLVKKNLISEIKLSNNNQTITLYSSVPFYKLIQHVNNIRIEKEKENQELLDQLKREKEEKELKQSKKPIVTTKSVTIPSNQVNHLSNKSVGFKRKTLSTPTKSVDGETKKFKAVGSFNSNISPTKTNSVEYVVDKELMRLEMERKRLLKSIQEKKALLENMKSKGDDNPIHQQKLKLPSKEDQKKISYQITKWKKGSQLAINMFQEKMVEMIANARKDDPLAFTSKSQKNQNNFYGSSTNGDNGSFRKKSNNSTSNISFKSSKQWVDEESDIKNTSTNNNYEEESTSNNYSEMGSSEYSEYSDSVEPEEEVPPMESKLYVMKSFGFNPKFLNYDEENDVFT